MENNYTFSLNSLLLFIVMQRVMIAFWAVGIDRFCTEIGLMIA
jgi:hypothetical protein